ncbi:MAG TPA: beta-propeller domain-containing protein, partial [Vulgatibacter sp.]
MFLSGVAAFSLVACGGASSPAPRVDDPRPGDTRFISADGAGPAFDGPTRGGGAPAEDGANDGAGGTSGDGGDRTVEEGDVYRAFGENLLLNLNFYRGLQVIDLSDLANPRVLSRLEVSGMPVELYVAGDRAVVLLNDWIGYYGSRFSPALSQVGGGLILLVDLSNPQDPSVIGSEVVPGTIRTSRLARFGEQLALYVVSNDWQAAGGNGGGYGGSAVTAVRSFDLSGSSVLPRSQLDLGGWVADIQATPEALLVARTDWTAGTAASRVSLVDISRTDGVMVEGDEVQLAGVVSTQFNMDLHKGILRVVSGSTWGGTPHNHLETFDASDPAHLVPVDAKTFGTGESLFGTMFLGNSAFFVTYLRQDPFHAFEITDEGVATEKSQFIVSGWNDWFRPVFSGSRLVGIGVDDASSRKLAVSLYDVTDLESSNPLVERA